MEKSQALESRLSVKLSVSVAEVIGGVSEQIERLTGQAGMLIMKAVMDAEVESLAGPNDKHYPIAPPRGGPRRAATGCWRSGGKAG